MATTANRHEFEYDEVKGLPYFESLQAMQEGSHGGGGTRCGLAPEDILRFFRNRGRRSQTLGKE